MLDSQEVSAITKNIRNILGNAQIATTIIYKQTGTTIATWDAKVGTLPDFYQESSVSAFKGSYQLYETENSGGLIEYGDVKFICMADDTTAGQAISNFSVDDRIVESATSYQSATTYEVLNVGIDPLRICYYIHARSV